MSIISLPISKEDFNKLYTQRIQNYSPALRLNAVNYFAACVGATPYLDALVNGSISIPESLTDEVIQTIISYIPKGKSPTPSVIQKIRDEYPHIEVDYTNQFIFIGDIADFTASFFPGMLPSITKVIIEHLVFNKVVNVFGPTTKRFLLLKNWDISEVGILTIKNRIEAFSEKTYNEFSNELKNYIVVSDQSLRNYRIDQEYLLDIIDRLSKRVVELETALETQQKEGVNGYLLSWH